MRVLIVASLAARYPDLVAELAADSDSVIAADRGAAACLAAGVAPALVVGDLDSLGEDDEVRLRQLGSTFMTVPAEKDETDLDIALGEARRFGASEIWLTGALGERLDHTIASVGSVSRFSDLRPRIVEPGLKAWVLGLDGRSRLRLTAEGALVSIFAIGAPASVRSAGLAYPLSGDVLQPLDSRGLSNVITEGQAVIDVLDGVLFVMSVEASGMLLAREVVSAQNTE